MKRTSLSASDIYTLYRPSACERRVYLLAHETQKAEESEFDKLMKELGARHELNHLNSFPSYVDINQGDRESRITKTLRAIQERKDVIYQGVFEALNPGDDTLIIGIPDFLIRDGDGYKIRDCKLSRHVGKGRHEEIILQLELYGWLFEQNTGSPPTALEVYLGDQSIARLTYNGGTTALSILRQIQGLRREASEPYSPVGWTKCGSCAFRDHCWGLAKQQQDVALVFGLDQATAIALREQGVSSIDQLLTRFDNDSLSELKKTRGDKMVRVGSGAERILLQAEALTSGKEKLIAPLKLPAAENLVMFDLEGLPPQFDELDKVYLWGLQVYGSRPGKFMPAVAGFSTYGDRKGWEDFLGAAERIFKEHGDIPFIHWANYETTKLKSYISRYGDRNGIAERVLDNCVDLLIITRDALVLPEYSYSLKVIEKRAGFKRTMKEFGGDWSIVQYIKAVETEDESLRRAVMEDILRYNEEDLRATWAVFQWLKGKNKT
ncbi:MAG TPA: TM0106 family RecB-like putative nuclease [Bacteroidota bacterium]|jgi:predicted RecB family nuclease|nr:TM0106 family RecB-like putative nuclease [Bacteroidota bacterium]